MSMRPEEPQRTKKQPRWLKLLQSSEPKGNGQDENQVSEEVGKPHSTDSCQEASPVTVPFHGGLESLEAVPANEWLDGTVHHASSFGVFVDVHLPGSNGPTRGLVYVTEMDRYPFDPKTEPEHVFPPGHQVRVRVIDLDAEEEGTLLLSMRTDPLDLNFDMLARGQALKECGDAEVSVGLRVRNPVHQRKGQVVRTPWGEPPIFLVKFDDGTVHARRVSKFVTEDGRALAMSNYPSSATGSAGSCWTCKRRCPLDQKAKTGHRYCYVCWRNFLFE